MSLINKTICIFLLNLFFAFNTNAQDHTQLTTEQKVADFDSLYCQLKGAFPYFAVNKRLNNIDWLANYDNYKSKIENTKDDKEFLLEVDTIIGELNCSHADLLPTEYYSYMFTRYKMASWVFRSYKRYVQELKKYDAKQKNKYWTEVCKELYPNSKIGSNLSEFDKGENISIETFKESSLAVIHIKSFLYEYIKQDKAALLEFYSTLNAYDNLIIDLQGNSGGDTRYWQKNIVPYLSDTSITYSSYIAFRNTPEFKSFAGDFKGFSADSIKLKNIPEELYTGNYLIKKTENKIKTQKNSIHYKGHIYVLADHGVYSSTEAFVNFCANTGFAKVVGETTGGDGIGADPFLYTLPISGIVTRYSGIMGLNADGSSNEETGTIPEIAIEGENSEERFLNLKAIIEG